MEIRLLKMSENSIRKIELTERMVKIVWLMRE